MECNKVLIIAPGMIQFQKCECEQCESKRLATKEFYERFDALHNQYMGQGE